MKPSTHETAPHGLAPLPAHPEAVLGGLGMHGCLGRGRRCSGDLLVMNLRVSTVVLAMGTANYVWHA